MHSILIFLVYLAHSLFKEKLNVGLAYMIIYYW